MLLGYVKRKASIIVQAMQEIFEPRPWVLGLVFLAMVFDPKYQLSPTFYNIAKSRKPRVHDRKLSKIPANIYPQYKLLDACLKRNKKGALWWTIETMHLHGFLSLVMIFAPTPEVGRAGVFSMESIGRH